MTKVIVFSLSVTIMLGSACSNASDLSKSADRLKLADGRVLEIPKESDVDQWATKALAGKDAKAIADACRAAAIAEEDLSERTFHVCGRAAHWEAMTGW